jgi:alkylation response protein AidB-like acyl-CoA dehydrogenase
MIDIAQTVDGIATEVVQKQAAALDETAAFPDAAIARLSDAGLLGLVSAREMGGMGAGLRQATQVVQRLARECGSTAMVMCMHYSAASVIEALGDETTRRAIASGKHLTTLAFSEAGSRSQFWAPVSTAQEQDGQIVLNATKSWVTSAHKAQSYVWSSKPVAGADASTIWLVASNTPGLRVTQTFDGLGLRANDSCPIVAENAKINPARRLGADGQGFQIMLEMVLPWFNVMSAATAVGLMESATTKSAAHASGTTFQHAQSQLADLMTIRAYIARMRIKTDMAHALVEDTLDALESGREDAVLRVLESKAAAGDTASEVTDLAMRVCGGAAFRKEVGVERVFRDARASLVMAPTSDVLYDFIGKATCGMPLF